MAFYFATEKLPLFCGKNAEAIYFATEKMPQVLEYNACLGENNLRNPLSNVDLTRFRI